MSAVPPRVAILVLLDDVGPLSGLQLLEHLEERGRPVQVGVLYPALAKLERDGLTTRAKGERRTKRGAGAPPIINTITPPGRELVVGFRRQVKRLYSLTERA